MPFWEQLEPHLPQVYRFALRLAGDSHVAEDLSQETYLRAWRGRRQLRNAKSARVWLFRITANLWRDMLRRGRNHPKVVSTADETVDLSNRLPEHIAIQKETVQQALRIADSLPPRQREVIHLAAVEGLTPSEIGEILDISRNAAKVHLCEARKTMRKKLTPADENVPSID